MIDITKIYSREAVQFFVFLVKNKIQVFDAVDVKVPAGHNITSCKSQLFIKYSLTLSYPDDEPYIFCPSNMTVAHLPLIFKQCIIICKNNTSEFLPPVLIGI